MGLGLSRILRLLLGRLERVGLFAQGRLLQHLGDGLLQVGFVGFLLAQMVRSKYERHPTRCGICVGPGVYWILRLLLGRLERVGLFAQGRLFQYLGDGLLQAGFVGFLLTQAAQRVKHLAGDLFGHLFERFVG